MSTGLKGEIPLKFQKTITCSYIYFSQRGAFNTIALLDFPLFWPGGFLISELPVAPLGYN